MKKLLCALCLLLLLALCIPSFASAIDFSTLDLFSQLSVEDLLRARNVLTEELMKRGYSECTLNKGSFTVGDDIKPGTYMLSTFDDTVLSVLSAEGDRIDNRRLQYTWKYHETVEAQGALQIELVEGQTVEIWHDTVTLYTY